MKGFLEELRGKTYIVRLGTDRKQWDDPYEFACVFNVPDGSTVGEFKACVTKPPTLQAVKEAIRLLNAAGYQVEWKRLTKTDPYSMEQQPSLNGEINMVNDHKTANPKSKATKLPDDPMALVINNGKVDWAKMDAVYAQIKADEQAGHLVVVNMKYNDHNGERNFHVHSRAV